MEESPRPLAPHVNCTAGEQTFFPSSVTLKSVPSPYLIR